MKTIQTPWIKLKENLDREAFDQISKLQEECLNIDSIAMKLELDYKLAAASEGSGAAVTKRTNEFMYFDGQQMIGYIGIGEFGGAGAPLEITGMVHPEYRRQGVFSMLHELVLAECKRRNEAGVLLLCDKNSRSGQKFIEKTNAAYQYSEFEMYLQPDWSVRTEDLICDVTFRKASNEDAQEVARQNAIYFEGGAIGEKDTGNDIPEDILMPEEEEKRGMTIYLAEKDQQVIGKVHLQLLSGEGGIYGLGVLPEYRGKGYGRAILLGSIEKLIESGAWTILLQVAAENATALNLYNSCGFMETSTMDYYKLEVQELLCR